MYRDIEGSVRVRVSKLRSGDERCGCVIGAAAYQIDFGEISCDSHELCDKFCLVIFGTYNTAFTCVQSVTVLSPLNYHTDGCTVIITSPDSREWKSAPASSTKHHIDVHCSRLGGEVISVEDVYPVCSCIVATGNY